MDEIKVTVCKYPDRKHLVLRYIDPISGKQKTRSAKTASEGDAIKEAGKWEDELRTGRYQAPSRLTWAEFRKRYETEKLSGLGEKTQQTAGTAMNHLERVINPDRLCKLTTATLSRFQAELRKPYEVVRGDKQTMKPGMKDVTITSILRHLRPALSWAVSMGLLPKMPDFHPPKRPKGQTLMRGRPITAEEFDRMIAAVPKVRPHDAPAWIRYLTGLWLSGLRLEESLALSWNQDSPFYADLTGKRPAFRIYAEAQKARRDEVLPMTPDFAQWLLQTPEAERHGRVFKLDGLQTGKPITAKRVCRLVAKVGRKAGVVVNKADGKYASAHDLRRAFGTRWAKRVMPAVLKRLMRHASIDTTMSFYVDLDADEMATDLWAKFGGEKPSQGNIFGNNAPNQAKKAETVPADDSTETVKP
ncbi:MAG: tyrosine-type recombinase/integrase [Thermoguttaceae bacterium]